MDRRRKDTVRLCAARYSPVESIAEAADSRGLLSAEDSPQLQMTAYRRGLSGKVVSTRQEFSSVVAVWRKAHPPFVSPGKYVKETVFYRRALKNLLFSKELGFGAKKADSSISS